MRAFAFVLLAAATAHASILVDKTDLIDFLAEFGQAAEEGTAHSRVGADGSIFLYMNCVASYQLFIGKDETARTDEAIKGLNALNGEINFVSPFTLRTIRLPDSYFEGTGTNELIADRFDTGVNLNRGAMGNNYLLLQYQVAGHAPVTVAVAGPRKSVNQVR